MLLTSSASAADFQQTMTCDKDDPSSPLACKAGEVPKPVYWPGTCVAFHINEAGTQNVVDVPKGWSEELENAVIESFETWTELDCTGIRIEYAGPTDNAAVGMKSDLDSENQNIIVWRDENWTANSPMALALTSVNYDPNSGRIADADIEINTEMHPVTVDSEPDHNQADLRNTLVHEVGHFVGLAHTTVRDATMYESAAKGETKKRTLHEVDIDGICHIYPADTAPESCDPHSDDPVTPRDVLQDSSSSADERGCATSEGSPMQLAWLFIFGGWFLAASRRR